MKFQATELPDVIMIEPQRFGDARGFFVESWNQRVFDVAVDLRRSSRTFGRGVGVHLSAADGRMLWVPPGFAHGFYVLSAEGAEFQYKCTGYYAPEHERSLLWNDAEIGIGWPLVGGRAPTLSGKDGQASGLGAADVYP